MTQVDNWSGESLLFPTTIISEKMQFWKFQTMTLSRWYNIVSITKHGFNI